MRRNKQIWKLQKLQQWKCYVLGQKAVGCELTSRAKRKKITQQLLFSSGGIICLVPWQEQIWIKKHKS